MLSYTLYAVAAVTFAIALVWGLFRITLWAFNGYIAPKAPLTRGTRRFIAGAIVAAELTVGLSGFWMLVAPIGSINSSLSGAVELPEYAPAPPVAPVSETLRPAPPNPADLVRQQVSQAVPGLIAFNPPTTMTVGISQKMTIRISRNLAQETIKKGLQGTGTPQIETIQVNLHERAPVRRRI
jgi:hypothetical protein